VVHGDSAGELLLIGWGGTRGAIYGAGERLRQQGKKVSTLHLRYLNPLPPDLFTVMSRFKKVIVPELNLGQLAFVLRGRSLIDVKSILKVQGQPFREQEIMDKCLEHLAGKEPGPFLIRTIEDVVAPKAN
jgi:2-oxoglutarate ferredoxin oxidoreductase subunit alpha